MVAHLAPGEVEEESSIQVSLLLGEIYSFIIPPLASFLAGDTCKLISSLCYLARIIMLQKSVTFQLHADGAEMSRQREAITAEGTKRKTIQPSCGINYNCWVSVRKTLSLSWKTGFGCSEFSTAYREAFPPH